MIHEDIISFGVVHSFGAQQLRRFVLHRFVLRQSPGTEVFRNLVPSPLCH